MKWLFLWQRLLKAGLLDPWLDLPCTRVFWLYSDEGGLLPPHPGQWQFCHWWLQLQFSTIIKLTAFHFCWPPGPPHLSYVSFPLPVFKTYHTHLFLVSFSQHPQYTCQGTVAGSRLAPSAPAWPSASRRAENHACQTPLQLSPQMCCHPTTGACWQKTWEPGSAHQAHVAFTFATVGSVGSIGLRSPQGWLKLPDLWLTAGTQWSWEETAASSAVSWMNKSSTCPGRPALRSPPALPTIQEPLNPLH